ncbi:glutaredoxin family protein [Angustibacter sp. McL0619]|uniref:glutaredoxin family protein n=1 Tax=Angustibacter sp. McL0619 TaxID=3415676 RepID=UPI003CED8D2C
MGDQGAQEPRITLIGRDGCHLCDEAREVVRRVADDTGAGWVEQRVDDDPELLHRYGEMVPVVLVDGSQHDYFSVDEKRLRAALTGRRAGRWGVRNR